MIKYNVLKLVFILSFILSLILLESDPFYIYIYTHTNQVGVKGSNHRIECYTSNFQLIASGLVSDSQFSINDN